MDIEISKEPVEYLSDFPQHLCNMCGKCCKAITTPYSWEELVELAKQGQEEAKVFVEVFVRYDSVDEARAAVPDHVENILNQLRKNNPDFDESKVTFFHCPHLTEDNKCAIHATRPDCCRRAPRMVGLYFLRDAALKGGNLCKKKKSKLLSEH